MMTPQRALELLQDRKIELLMQANESDNPGMNDEKLELMHYLKWLLLALLPPGVGGEYIGR